MCLLNIKNTVAQGAAVIVALSAFAMSAGIASGQETMVDITLERSDDLTGWESTPVTGSMINSDGAILLPMDKQAEFYRLKVTTIVVPPPPAPEGFALIPAGSFIRGFAEGSAHEQPARSIFVSDFYIARTEVTKEQWDLVVAWGWNNGYSDLPLGEGKGPDHPVQMVNWFDVVKWLNAWSEMEGRTPAYTLGTDVYRTGTGDPATDFSGNGYRLPTEAEWEKAARGGFEARRYSWWENVITAEHANVLGTVATTEAVPRTLPVGSFLPNHYGLYDTTGNVWEWVNDWYSATYYGESPEADPRGPDVPNPDNRRIFRGAAWNSRGSDQARISFRYSNPQDGFFNSVGFRAAYSAVE